MWSLCSVQESVSKFNVTDFESWVPVSVSQGVSSLNCLWVYIPGCKGPGLFMSVYPKCVRSLTCSWLYVAVYEVSVHGKMYQAWEIWALWVCVPDDEVSDQFGCLFPRIRDFWFGCGCIFQDVSSLIPLGMCIWGVRFLLCLWIDVPGYEVSDLFVIVCLRMWSLSRWVSRVWGLLSVIGFMSLDVRSLISF